MRDLCRAYPAERDQIVRDLKKALDANPKWKNDHSVPKTGDPFVRTEVVDL